MLMIRPNRVGPWARACCVALTMVFADAVSDEPGIAPASGGETCLDSLATTAFRSKNVRAMVVIGDSMSRAFNAGGGDLVQGDCPFADQLRFNWATNDNTARRCARDTVYSQKERLECANRREIASRNVARSGASMARDAHKQAVAASNWIMTQPGPRYVAILMGHNDICQGTQQKFAVCDSDDKDPGNYCRTTKLAFEREFRRTLDQLVQIPSSRIGVVIPVRVSQLCNHKGKDVACGPFTCNCQDVWDIARLELFDVFRGPGICESITSDGCSDARVADAYRTWKSYRNILVRVVKAYAAVAAGATVPVNAAFGTGGVTKAAGVQLKYSEAIAGYQIQSGDINTCDCYHADKTGQNKIARYLFTGLTCTPTSPCCRNVGNDVDDGRCRNTWTDGRRVDGLW